MVFLPTEFIGSNRQFWTDHFADILSRRKSKAIEDTDKPNILKIVHRLSELSGTYEEQLEAGIALLKTYSLNIIDEVLLELSRAWDVKDDGSDRNFLNWAEVREMRSSGLVSFGSHTVTHQILTTLDEPAFKSELVVSKDTLLDFQVIDNAFISFCYPNGNHTKAISDSVRASGYHLAVTTTNGWNQLDANRYTLKRIGIHQDMSSTIPLFACKIAGSI
jgi:peptidoglycan/xylan/chitin deacetylase (PgdA/CDA1 family)